MQTSRFAAAGVVKRLQSLPDLLLIDFKCAFAFDF